MNMLHSFDLDILFDTVPNAVFIKDENLRFIFINEAYEKMFNVKRREVLGKKVLDLEYLPIVDRIFYQEEDTEVVQGITTKHHIFDYLYKGKEKHTCLYWSSGFMLRDGRHGLIGVIVDINKQSNTIRALRNKLRITDSEKKKAAKTSMIDALTSLYSRRAFDETLQAFVASEKRVFSCLMLDIDHFKRVNDTFGHPAGDAVLAAVAASLKKSSRKPDTTFRYGGEEFAVLLPGTGLADAGVVAERIRSNICKNVRLPDGQPVTVSVGCGEYLPGEPGASVVQRADKALYAAKNSGRNRVCSQEKDG